MIKIKDKKFLKYIEETAMDFMEIGEIQTAKELLNILETKKLKITNISSIYDYLQYRIDNPSHYDMELEILIQQGITIHEALKMVSIIKKEHKYMYKIISRYFIHKTLSDGLVAISYKSQDKSCGKTLEVA